MLFHVTAAKRITRDMVLICEKVEREGKENQKAPHTNKAHAKQQKR
jgi:hypothetical protein